MGNRRKPFGVSLEDPWETRRFPSRKAIPEVSPPPEVGMALVLDDAFPKWGHPPVILHFRLGISLTKTIQLLGTPIYEPLVDLDTFSIPGLHTAGPKLLAVSEDYHVEELWQCRRKGVVLLSLVQSSLKA